MFHILVARDLVGAIGKDGKMPWHLPSDLSWFKMCTMGKIVIMGRKTLESIGGKGLPGRVNIVLSKTMTPGWNRELNYHVLDDVRKVFSHLPPGKMAYVIGGQEIYQKFLDMNVVTMIHETVIETRVEKPDTYFPLLDLDQWEHAGTVSVPPRDGDTHFSYRNHWRKL